MGIEIPACKRLSSGMVRSIFTQETLCLQVTKTQKACITVLCRKRRSVDELGVLCLAQCLCVPEDVYAPLVYFSEYVRWTCWNMVRHAPAIKQRHA